MDLVLSTRVLKYIFEVLVLVLVLMEIMGYVLVLMLNVFRFYEYISTFFKYDDVIIIYYFI